MRATSPQRQLAGFIAKFTPEIAAQTHAVLAKMRALLPDTFELVYDNYNALAIAFSPTERPSDFVFSVAVYPRWVSLFFAKGVRLPDPQKLLKGNGTTVRHIVLETPEMLDKPSVRVLMAHALADSIQPIDSAQRNRIIIKCVAANQRPRRPLARARKG